jgi:hypothetical protein
MKVHGKKYKKPSSLPMPLGEACVGYRGQSRLQRRIIIDQTDSLGNKVHIKLVYQPQCLSPCRIGTPPPPPPQASVSPPKPKGGGHTRLRVRGSGRVPIRTTGEKAQNSVYSVHGWWPSLPVKPLTTCQQGSSVLNHTV